MADYGIGIAATTDRPSPERLASGTTVLAYDLARSLLQENGAAQDIGDPVAYRTLNLRDWLGARPTDAEIQQLNRSMKQVLEQDERVDSVTAVATFSGGTLRVLVSGTGDVGPFQFIMSVLSVSSVTLEVLV